MTFSGLAQNSFHNVEQYSSDLLQKVNGSVQVPVTYTKSWKRLELDINKQSERGHDLQKFLEVIDQKVKKLGIDYLYGHIRINNSHVSFTINVPDIIDLIEHHHVAVTWFLKSKYPCFTVLPSWRGKIKTHNKSITVTAKSMSRYLKR